MVSAPSLPPIKPSPKRLGGDKPNISLRQARRPILILGISLLSTSFPSFPFFASAVHSVVDSLLSYRRFCFSRRRFTHRRWSGFFTRLPFDLYKFYFVFQSIHAWKFEGFTTEPSLIKHVSVWIPHGRRAWNVEAERLSTDQIEGNETRESIYIRQV